MQLSKLRKDTSKLEKIETSKLNKILDLNSIDIEKYKISIKNYDSARMERNGIPYLNSLLQFEDAVKYEIRRRA